MPPQKKTWEQYLKKSQERVKQLKVLLKKHSAKLKKGESLVVNKARPLQNDLKACWQKKEEAEKNAKEANAKWEEAKAKWHEANVKWNRVVPPIVTYVAKADSKVEKLKKSLTKHSAKIRKAKSKLRRK
jgi:hypothetical protein